MKIALVTIEYPPDTLRGGLSTYTATVARELTARGHKVFVVTRGEKGDRVDDEAGVIVHRLTPGRPAIPKHLGVSTTVKFVGSSFLSEIRYRRNVANTLQKLVDTEGVQLIEAAEAMAEPLLYALRRQPLVPFVVRMHMGTAFSERIDPNIPGIARRGIRLLERLLLQRATHLTAASTAAASAFLNEYKLTRQVTVYPNPPSYPVTTREPGVEDPNLVLFVGRVTLQKGADLLIRSIPGRGCSQSGRALSIRRRRPHVGPGVSFDSRISSFSDTARAPPARYLHGGRYTPAGLRVLPSRSSVRLSIAL